MDMPRPTQGHDVRQMMVGVREGEESVHPSPFEEAGGARYTHRMEVSPDGNGWFPFLEGRYRRS